MNISRQHAKIVYNFERKCFELIVQGKNGVSVGGNLYTPASAPQELQSQDLLTVGDKSFYFLLPKQRGTLTGGKRKAGQEVDSGRKKGMSLSMQASTGATPSGAPGLSEEPYSEDPYSEDPQLDFAHGNGEDFYQGDMDAM